MLNSNPIVFEATATSYFSKSSMMVSIFGKAKAVNGNARPCHDSLYSAKTRAVNGKAKTNIVVHNQISLKARDSDCLLTTG